jgi:uncharacterized OB-fold protein
MSNLGTLLVTAALAHPDLYREVEGNVVLLAARCTVCNHIAFPRQRYGCEKCGATSPIDVELPAVGTLASFATVHLHQSSSIAAPFVIGEVKLDAGPTLRLTLVEPTDAGLRIGARMKGVLHAQTVTPAVTKGVTKGRGDAQSDPSVTETAVAELRFTKGRA